MCWFVTIGVSRHGAAELETLGRQRGLLQARPSVNSDLAAIFPRADVRFEITHGGCSCDLYWTPPEEDPAEREQAARRYRKKGWSEAKIARALDASAQAKSAPIGRNPEMGPERLFRELIAAQVRRFGSIRLFAHMYQGVQDEERVRSEGSRRISLEELLEQGFPPDVLVEVSGTA